MKGMELPINMIVVVLIAVLVLTTVGIFLTQQFFTNTGEIDYQKLYGQGCSALRFQYSCDYVNANIDLSVKTASGTSTVSFFNDVCPKVIKAVTGDIRTACGIQCGC